MRRISINKSQQSLGIVSQIYLFITKTRVTFRSSPVSLMLPINNIKPSEISVIGINGKFVKQFVDDCQWRNKSWQFHKRNCWCHHNRHEIEFKLSSPTINEINIKENHTPIFTMMIMWTPHYSLQISNINISSSSSYCI